MSYKFYITEVFAEGPYAGNQLATLFNADSLSTDEMQKIARTFNFAETTFVTGGSLEVGFDVRIFTPNSELLFAGHPTLGTSFLIKRELLKQDVSELTLNLGVGPITVEFSSDDILWMRQNEPSFGKCIEASVIAEELGLDVALIASDMPCQLVSTGLEFLIVPVKSYEALKSARGASGQAPGYLVFCAGGYNDEQQIQARMFAGSLGVPEDAATGSANGCLAAYLAEYQYFGASKVDFKVGQGYEIDRPSQLYLRSEKRGDEFLVEVGGKVRFAAEGQWLI